jgi:hypothetical protein
MVARMNAYERIRDVWQGGDLPNNSEIIEAAERYRERANYYRASDGNWIEGLALLIARSPRSVWAPLFGRPIDPADYKRQGA